MPKEKMKRADLAGMIMSQVRKTAECQDIDTVVITEIASRALHHPNWRFSFSGGAARALMAAGMIARSVQARYDCIF